MQRKSIREFATVVGCMLGIYLTSMMIALLYVGLHTNWKGTLPRGLSLVLGSVSGIVAPFALRYVRALRSRAVAVGWQWPGLPSWRAVASGVLDFILSNLFIILAAALAYVWGKTAPAPESLLEPAATIYDVTLRYGGIWFSLWTLYRVYIAVASKRDGFWDLVREVLARMLMLVLAQIAVCKFAPFFVDLVQTIEARPHESIATTIGLLLVYAAFRTVDRHLDTTARQYVSARVAVTDAAGVASAYKRRPRTPDAIRRTAVHEAGHALLFAALPTLPDNFVAKVLGDLSAVDRYRGFVRGTVDCLTTQTEVAVQWSMFLDLAGTTAEKLVYGNRADGASEDNDRWTRTAQHYLSHGYGEVYFATPATDLEAESNQRALNRLKDEHCAALEEFLKANRAVLDELADRLARDGQLDQEGIRPYLDRVEYTSRIQPLSEQDVT
ncbi:ATP-dependent metallopeptidase FtsH/Yme1/Tma family protein [Burkholderia cepacia]|uniref:hypothetical protein n=1 Tax=Burkholderia cepacia TaxID=292 RepID=UPI002AB6BA73|nr:hypothetical protein [Burkholderia cepacia]